MNEQTFKVVTLNWERLDVNIQHLPSGGIDKFKFPIGEISGLYQVYGASIYGLDSLLYIGQTKNLNKRLSQHLFGDTMISRQQNLSIRYALVDADQSANVSVDEMLDITESINIATHKPCLNSQSIVTPYTKGLYLVQNHGERGVLNLQITNSYWYNPV